MIFRGSIGDIGTTPRETCGHAYAQDGKMRINHEFIQWLFEPTLSDSLRDIKTHVMRNVFFNSLEFSECG